MQQRLITSSLFSYWELLRKFNRFSSVLYNYTITFWSCTYDYPSAFIAHLCSQLTNADVSPAALHKLNSINNFLMAHLLNDKNDRKSDNFVHRAPSLSFRLDTEVFNQLFESNITSFCIKYKLIFLCRYAENKHQYCM